METGGQAQGCPGQDLGDTKPSLAEAGYPEVRARGDKAGCPPCRALPATALELNFTFTGSSEVGFCHP